MFPYFVRKHGTLYNGDCLEVMTSIPDSSVDMVLCDLPYGTTANKWDKTIDLELLWKQYNRIAKVNATFVFFAQIPFSIKLGSSNLSNLRYEWTWKKGETNTGFLNANKMPLKNHENILVFYRKLPTYNPQKEKGIPYKARKDGRSTNYHVKARIHSTYPTGERYPLDVLNFKPERGLHPTQKPVALLEYLIKTYTNEGETVLDNCAGSGSTLVAAQDVGRKFIGIELDEKYYKIATNRLKG